ncbi:MAG: hypothetical protein ACR2PA_23925, partial [Hyphomicrobiaceae bacterium]
FTEFYTAYGDGRFELRENGLRVWGDRKFHFQRFDDGPWTWRVVPGWGLCLGNREATVSKEKLYAKCLGTIPGVSLNDVTEVEIDRYTGKIDIESKRYSSGNLVGRERRRGICNPI